MPKEFDLKFLGTRCRQENRLFEIQNRNRNRNR